jgi:predicted RNA-binding protein with TRAM domain
LQLLSGTCGSFTSLACGNTSIIATGLTAGTTYYIRVYTQNVNTGAFNICVTHAPPANDDCAGAITLSSSTSCINTAGTLNIATANGSTPLGCFAAGTYYDVWYSFVAANTTETVTISGLGVNITNPQIQIYGGTCGALTNLSACGTTSVTKAGLTIGTTYYVRVANLASNPSGSGTVANFNICITHTGPANDLCSGAISLTPGSSCVNTAGTLVGATYTTISSIGCGVASRNDVWYSFTATSTSSTITLTTAAANPRLQLFSGTCGSLTSLACGSSTLTSTSLTIGTTYYVRVYTDPNDLTATFNICVTNTSVANDDCSGAISLVSGNACTNTAGTLNGSTVSAGLPIGCESAGPHYDVWYKFVAVSTTETITISSLGSNITSSEIQLYSGVCGTLVSVACNATAITQGGLVVGTTYYVRVSNVGSNPSGSGTVANFNICVTHTGVVNDLCANAITLTSGYTCSYTTGTMANSTVTSTATACSGPTVKYDVWYSFIAQSATPTITLNNVGANFSSPKIEIFSGSCAGSSVYCNSISPSVTPTLTIGTLYYVRIFSSNNPIPTTNANFDICITDPGPPTNDACSGATTLTSSTTCNTTAGTLAYATSSSPSVASSCGTPGADVWYSFVAQSAFPSISLTNIGSSLSSGTTYIQLLSGSCGVFTSILCLSGTGSSLSLLPGGTGLTIGTTYYVRVYSPTANPTTGTWGYDICVQDPGTSSTANINYSKSYVNITKLATGGTTEPGDILEIRATFVVLGGTVDSVAFYDTLQSNSGFTLQSGTISTQTNEGKIYKSFSDSYDSDAGWYGVNGSDTTVQINFGSGASNVKRGSITFLDRPKVYSSATIIMATYRVQVYAGYTQKIDWGGGAFTYRDRSTGNMKTLSFKSDSLVVYVSPGLCSGNLSTNNFVNIETAGTFGTPSTGAPLARNRGTSTAVPSYVYKVFATGTGPNDYYYGIANNTSSTYTTLNTFPKSGTVAQRVFNLWDITGDHTGATNTAKGNPPCDTTQPVSATNPCGYMLVVNAAYKTDTAFRSTITGLCPNTYYEFSAWVKNICYKCGCDSTGTGASGAGYIPFAPNDSSGVPPNLAWQIDGQDYYTTGNIYYTGTGPGITQQASDSVNAWVKRGFVYKTGPTQTSFELVVRNNAPGGGGNDWAIDDIALRTCMPNMSYSPTTSPTTCLNNPKTIYDTVRCYYDTYTEYKWQRSTNGGATWTDLGSTGNATPVWNGSAWEYVVSYSIPGSAATASNDGDMYRLVVATTGSNLSSGSCIFTDPITITLDVLTNCGPPLKTDLLSIAGKLNNDKAKVSWTTTKEEGSVYFQLQRSADGNNFTTIASVNGYNNTAAENNYYSYDDPTSVTGKVYYRVIMNTTNSGSKKYSRIIQLNPDKKDFGLGIVVNPFSSELEYEIITPQTGIAITELIDQYGATVRKQTQKIDAGVNALMIASTDNLPAGVYTLKVSMNGSFVVRRVLKGTN